MVDRFIERAKTRDPVLEQNLQTMLASDARDNSIPTLLTNPDKFREIADEETRPFREYMVNESIQQYKDYYESDAEEATFFEYLDNLPNRDKIRFMEIFEDFTVDKMDAKEYVMIEKREYNPELSVVSNMALDMVDFKDRVRPLTTDIAQAEYGMKFQKENATQMLDARAEFRAMVDELAKDPEAALKVDEGYSSMEIETKEAQKATEAAAAATVLAAAEAQAAAAAQAIAEEEGKI